MKKFAATMKPVKNYTSQCYFNQIPSGMAHPIAIAMSNYKAIDAFFLHAYAACAKKRTLMTVYANSTAKLSVSQML